MKKLEPLFRLLFVGLIGLGLGPVKQSEVRRVEIVIEGRTNRVQPQVSGLRDGLEELKYVEGKNLVLNLLQDDAPERLRSMLAAQIQRDKVDVIVALGVAETAIAKHVTQTIPIIFLPTGDPIQSGFVRSLARPETNLTGLTFFTDTENVGKQLEVFKDVVPSLRQVITISDGRQRSDANDRRQKRLKSIASHLGIELTEQSVRSPAEARELPLSWKPASGAGIFVVCSGLFRDLTGLASAATKGRMPLFGCNGFQVAEQQVLMTYAPDLYSIGYRGAGFVDRIFKGAMPQNLPVETPTKFDLVINRRIAAEIGLKIPPKMLLLADRVFD